MFSPYEDLTVIQKLLAEDSTILTLMGLGSATNLEKAKSIIKRDNWDDLPTGQKRICIYYQYASNVRNEIISREIMRIDVHVPIVDDAVAYQLQQRIHVLLHNKKHGRMRFQSIGQVGQIGSLPGFYAVGTRFKYYITK